MSALSEEEVSSSMNDTNTNKEDDECLYQIYISNADDINNDLNGLYEAVFDEHKLPQIKHTNDSLFTPNFIFYRRSDASNNEYGIFIIPSLPSMNLYKPTWVISQIDTDEIVHFYASSVDFKQPNAMKVPLECKWIIVGDDGSNEVCIKLKIIKIGVILMIKK